jgi:hypothetical protein
LDNKEADKIIDRLKYSFTFNKFDEPGAIGEYKRVLAKYSFEQMSRAVDNLIDNDKDGKNVPPIPALIKACKENSHTAVEIHNDVHCDICNDKGYILTKEIMQNGDEQLPYETVYYCPFCQVGQSQAYNGNNSKEHKCNAVCFPITSIMDEQAIAQLRYSNNHPTVMTSTEKELLRKKLWKIGLPMPQALNRGDAWEGDAPWEQN